MAGPTWLEIFAAYLLLRGTHAARPNATTVPEGAEYYETDTTNRFKAVGGAWVADSGSGGGAAGPLSLVETITVAVSTDTLTFADLDGDADGRYLLASSLINDTAGTVIYTVRPNGVTTNQRSSTFYSSPTGNGNEQNTLMEIARVDANLGCYAETKLDPRAGKQRTGFSTNSHSYISGDLQVVHYDTAFVWTDDSTQITSLELHADDADGFGVNSVISLYKLAP